MKFLCPSCKAKYQIADEKVAGRSVRMKCRKCAFMIQVSSAGAGAASSRPPPGGSIAPEADAPAATASDAPSAPAPAEKSSPVGAKAPAEKSSPVGAKAPAEKSSPVGAQAPAKKLAPPPRTAPRAQKPAATVSRASAPTASARKTAEPLQPRKAGGAALASAPQRAAVPAPRAPQARATAPAQAVRVEEQPTPQDIDDEDEATRIADSSALAGAFSQAFKDGAAAATEKSSTTELSMPADEWFVGINGVPVGPIRLSELRSKAASGAVTKESLVWRDGFEDWRPLHTFPELSAIVDESVSSVRASLTPLTPHASSVTISDPFADTKAAPAAAAPAASPSMATGVVVSDDLEAAGLQRRRTPVAAWIALVVALFCGLTIGFVLFGGQKEVERVVERVVEVPAKAAQKSEQTAAAEGVQNAVEETTVAADTKSGVKRPSTATKATAPAEPENKNSGLAGLKGLSGLSGPRGPEGSGPSGTVSGGGQLDSAQVQSTVSRYTGSVKRSCWQPALDTRDKDAPTSARVVVTITVNPSGSVANATTSGDPRGYRGLASCIAARVRGWQFPPSGETTTVNVPFVFAAQ